MPSHLPSPDFATVPAARRRRPLAAVGLAAALTIAAARPSRAAGSVDFKFQDYREGGGRVHVVAQYARVAAPLPGETHLTVQTAVDTITGASPTGEPAPAGSDQVPLAQLRREVRRAATVALDRSFGRQDWSASISYSKEPDYLSRAFALTDLINFNEKNTGLQLGYAHAGDSVNPFFFAAPRPRRSDDVIVGLTQILDAETTVSINLSHSGSRGYLADPYKAIVKAVVADPAHPELLLTLPFPENRPADRSRWVLFLSGTHYFARLRGSLEASYRHTRDDWGVTSHTGEVAWIQKLGTAFLLQPHFRLYTQSAADFYRLTLDGTAIDPRATVQGEGPFYSADYRLARFAATSVGLKLIVRLGHRLSLDLDAERYAMRGRDGVTPQSAFPTANILSAGGSFTF